MYIGLIWVYDFLLSIFGMFAIKNNESFDKFILDGIIMHEVKLVLVKV